MAAPRIGGPKEFWNRIKDISVTDIAREANRPISVAFVGSDVEPGKDAQFYIDSLNDRGEATKKPKALPSTPFLMVYPSMSPDDGFPQQADVFDFVIDIGGGRVGAPVDYKSPIYSIAELGGWQETVDRIFNDRQELMLALARSFPIFRTRAAQQVIQQTAMTNAEFSLITGVASAFPLLELIWAANALSDILILTKNQIMMTLRLSAIYGLEVNYRSRMRELGPILVNAFGWRAVARELVGAVPAIGFIFRAMISYAGTVAVGKAAQLYYESGETVSRSQAQRFYREAYGSSREKIRALAQRLRPSKRGGGGGGRSRVPSIAANTNELQADFEPAEKQEKSSPS